MISLTTFYHHLLGYTNCNQFMQGHERQNFIEYIRILCSILLKEVEFNIFFKIKKRKFRFRTSPFCGFASDYYLHH